MVQLKILSGKMAGTAWVARRFPVQIGRAEGDLRLEEPGVWDRHVRLEFVRNKGVVVVSAPDAITSVNGEQVERATLRNGDLLDLGGLRLQFWLSDTMQKSLGFREWLTWGLIAVVSLAQVVLIYWLLLI